MKRIGPGDPRLRLTKPDIQVFRRGETRRSELRNLKPCVIVNIADIVACANGNS
jgi:hypothetical protein